MGMVYKRILFFGLKEEMTRGFYTIGWVGGGSVPSSSTCGLFAHHKFCFLNSYIHVVSTLFFLYITIKVQGFTKEIQNISQKETMPVKII